MSFIYADALREDEDLRNVLQSIRTADPVTDPQLVAVAPTPSNCQPLEIPRPKRAIAIVDDDSDGGFPFPNSTQYWYEYNTTTESSDLSLSHSRPTGNLVPMNVPSDASNTGHDVAREYQKL